MVTALCILTFASCTEPTKEPARKHIEHIGLSGMRTEFIEGDTFDTGDLTVTVSYSDGSTEVASSDAYTVDWSAYNKDVAGVYTIAVKLDRFAHGIRCRKKSGTKSVRSDRVGV